MGNAQNQAAVTDALAEESAMKAAETGFRVATPWELFWWKFKSHKLALISAFVVLFLYVMVAFAEFIAPVSPATYNGRYVFAPPQGIHLFMTDDEGWHFNPHVKGYSIEVDPKTYGKTFVQDPEQVFPVRLFARGESYRLWGLFETDRHLIGPVDPGAPFYLLGADRLGRDVFSRLVYGTRISMSIGLVGVAISLILGVFLGGVSGFYGGVIDSVIQRLIEILRSLPTIPLWMGLSAAIPLAWPQWQTYLAITVILSLIGWTALAREVRGLFLSVKNEDFVSSARLEGMGEFRITRKHMLPLFTSHIIATVSLTIPTMILAETALSFLGIGLQPPTVSWGVLLQEAQNIRSIAVAPWLFAPGVIVVIAVLALNFLGDGVRDAADPYQT
ncbi:ABC transporter permease [Oceaniglobus trochenteri]|uniref:ABC transporter permease n=1 Tax=Oceaniglobus trochenteri TaxID=2763260 RepID=UPI001CFF867D|nr:ABC transporter permease [Oceaniglobus trochenteri]